MSTKGHIRRLAIGVRGLDAILGGGLPEYSFNRIAGPPGSGNLQFEITDAGIAIGDPVLDYTGLLGGQPLQAPASRTVG